MCARADTVARKASRAALARHVDQSRPIARPFIAVCRSHPRVTRTHIRLARPECDAAAPCKARGDTMTTLHAPALGARLTARRRATQRTPTLRVRAAAEGNDSASKQLSYSEALQVRSGCAQRESLPAPARVSWVALGAGPPRHGVAVSGAPVAASLGRCHLVGADRACLRPAALAHHSCSTCLTAPPASSWCRPRTRRCRGAVTSLWCVASAGPA